jgi:hypothetical protein
VTLLIEPLVVDLLVALDAPQPQVLVRVGA